MIQLLGLGLALEKRVLLHPLAGTFTAGRVTAVLGPNGAGKSTLLNLVAAHRRGQTGHVRLNGVDIKDLTPSELALQRALLPQDTSSAFDFTVREIVELGRYPHRRNPTRYEQALVDAAMHATGVFDLRDRVFNTLSGGEKSRAQLARVLSQIWEPLGSGAPRWLLLDEPTAALDLSHQHHVLGLVRRWAQVQSVGIVAVLHDLNLALRYADDAVLLRQGRALAWGPTAEVLTRSTVSSVWGVDCEERTAGDGVPQFLLSAMA